MFTVVRCAATKINVTRGERGGAGGTGREVYLKGGAGILPLFWTICMLDVQLQHFVIQQL